jgi:multimeric flavodoxin WrbA
MMKVIILQSSPNEDGLTAACAQAAFDGVHQAGGMVETVRINDLALRHCQACDNGWGTCLSDHRCRIEDDFEPLHQRILQADALVLVTPVYWGEMSESAKALTDRLRRCEATRDSANGLPGSLLTAKPFLAVAAAGGTGGGMITCLASMERWAQHVYARVFDLIPVNRWSRVYKIEAIRAAAQVMAAGSF